IGFSQGKPLRQVKFRALNVNAQLRGGSFVTTTPPLAQATLRDFLYGRQKVSLPHAAVVRAKPSSRSHPHAGSTRGPAPAAAPLISHPDEKRKIGGRTYEISSDGSHIHLIAWHSGGALYWLTNTLLEDLSNAQMLAIARSARPLH